MKKRFRSLLAKVLAISTIFMMLFGSGISPLGVTAKADGTVAVTGISLNASAYYFSSDYFSDTSPTATAPTEQLTAAVTPTNADDQNVTWASSDTAVATVSSSGLVTAVSAGAALITATSEDGSYAASCTVYVPAISNDFESMTSGSNWSVVKKVAGATPGVSVATPTAGAVSGQAFVTTMSASGDRDWNKSFATAVSDASAGTNGKLYVDFDWYIGAYSNGCGSIAIQDSAGQNYLRLSTPLTSSGTETSLMYDTTPATTQYVPVTLPAETWGTETGIDITGPDFTYTKNAAGTYNVQVTLDFTNKTISFTLTDKSNASNTVTVGNIPFSTAATYKNDFKSIEEYCSRTSSTGAWTSWIDNFNVYPLIPSISSVSLSSSTLTLSDDTSAASSKAKLTATVNPASPGVNQNVTWTSSDASVATVDSLGNVSAVADGTATIVATSVGDATKSAACSITVQTIPISSVSITLDGSNIEGTTVDEATGTCLKLGYTINPSNAAYHGVSWSSDDQSIVKINAASGIAYVLAPGTATVTLTVNGSEAQTAQSFTVNAAGAAVTWQPVTGVALDKTSLALSTGGGTGILTPTIEPAAATDTNVLWSTSDPSVATVSSGVVTPVGTGSATITVTTDDGDFTATCAVTVSVGVTGIALDKSALSLSTGGDSGTLTPTIYPTNATDKNVLWSTSNASVATVSDGVVTPEGGGTATITATTEEGGYSATCAVTVVVSVSSITLTQSSLNLSVGGPSGSVDAILSPADAANRTVTWATSDATVATVSNGIVVPVSDGTAVITATTADGGLTAQCTVTVAAHVPVSGISLDKSDIILPVGGVSQVLNPAFSPADASNTGVTWTSSNTSVATVLNGIVTSVGAGTATITATTADGSYAAICTVTVIATAATITNDQFYKDTDGNPIYSQGGMILKVGDTYYWYGVHYKEAETYAANPQNGKISTDTFAGFSCYSSKDLVNWKNEGDIMTPSSPGADPTTGANMAGTGDVGSWIGRMGVAYDSTDNRYVLVSQYYNVENTAWSGIMWATCSTPNGQFTFDHLQTTVPIHNNGTGDQSVFIDDDGSAYLICSSASGRNYQYVIPMNLQNLTLGTPVQVGYSGSGLEGNCMFKYDGYYYLCSSDLHGWNASPAYVYKSDSTNILGSYSAVFTMNGSTSSYSHTSQTGFFYTVNGTQGSTVIFCGDRWSDFAGNGLGYNEWCPVTFSGTTPYFNDVSQWNLNATAGTWSVAAGDNYLRNGDFESDRVAMGAGAVEGWTATDNLAAANANISGKQYAGNFIYQQKAASPYNSSLDQVATGLPNGTYTLEAWVKSSGGQNVCNIYAKNYGGSELDYSVKTAISSWTQITINNIDVTNGQCEVGLYSDSPANDWVQLDNVTLTRNSVPVSGLTLNADSLTMSVSGPPQTLVPAVTPSNASDITVAWATSDPNVATVSDGTVTPVGVGTAIITATTEDGRYTASCTVNVVSDVVGSDATLSSISVDGTPLAGFVPGTLDYTYVVASGTTTVPTVTATPSDSGANAVVTQATSIPGTAAILVTAADGAQQTYRVSFAFATSAVSVTGVSLNKTADTIGVGKSDTLTATVEPSDATDSGITWSSGNPSVAGVDSNGMVTAVAPGSALITATTEDGGFTATCTVTVWSGSTGGSSPATPSPVTVIGTPTTNSDGTSAITATIPAGSTDISTVSTVSASLGNVTVQAPASVLNAALGGDSTASLSLSQSASAGATQQSVFQLTAANGGTPVAALDLSLVKVEANGATTAVHQLSDTVTVTVTLTAAQLAAIGDASDLDVYYYDTGTTPATLTDMHAAYDAAKGTLTFTTDHFSTYVIAKAASTVSVGVAYAAHVQHIGWQKFVADGAEAGTEHKALRLEGLQIKLTGDLPAGASIVYQAHVQKLGWQQAVQNGELAGTTGKSLRMEALRISLKGLSGYAVKYRAYVQNKGWLDWQTTANGTDISEAAVAGTTGKGLRMEAIQIEIVKVS